MLNSDIIKLGDTFELKDGRRSSFYVNMRDMISDTDLFHDASYALGETAENSFFHEETLAPLQHDRYLMAIPETASEYAGAISFHFDIPLLKRRVRQKTHGEPRPLEGKYHEGDDVVLLDDVISSAQSKLEAVSFLASLGLNTAGVVVLVDRQQGGRSELKENGIDFEAVLTISSIAKYALDREKISNSVYESVMTELDPREL